MNTNETHYENIAKLAWRIKNLDGVELLPYHVGRLLRRHNVNKGHANGESGNKFLLRAYTVLSRKARRFIMEITFSELRAKEVVNTQDGRKLGKVCDIVLCYPDNRWLGIVAPNGSGFGFKKNGLFIELKNIVKIGEDVILVNVGLPRKQCKKGGFNPTMPPSPSQNDCRRSYEEYE